MTQVLFFHPALAPYRLDFFNAVGAMWPTHIVFLQEDVTGHDFSRQATYGALKVGHGFCRKVLSVAGRPLPVGLGRYLRRHRPRVVVGTELSFVTLQLLLMRPFYGYRLVTVIDESPAQVQAAGMLKKLLRRWVLRRIDGVVVLSQAVQDSLRSESARVPLHVLPLIQDEQRHRQRMTSLSERAEGVRRRHGLGEKRVVLYVGRLAREKNLPFVLEAFERFAGARPDAVLVLVGDGPEEAHLRWLVSERGLDEKVILAGRLEGDSLYAWYLAADVFAIGSAVEPFGAVVNEALIYGLPVVCTATVGAASLIRGREQGRVVQPGDVAAFAQALAEQMDAGRAAESRMPLAFEPAMANFRTWLDDVVMGGGH